MSHESLNVLYFLALLVMLTCHTHHTVGLHHERGFLPGAVRPGDRLAQHRRSQWRRLHGLQVRRAGHLLRHLDPSRPHQQPLYPLARMVWPTWSLLESRRYVIYVQLLDSPFISSTMNYTSVIYDHTRMITNVNR